MPLRGYRPTSPGLRQMTRPTFDEITTDVPHKPLTERLFEHAGRNSQGKLTVRHQGSGHKRLYRLIDWKRDKAGVPARIATVEYDPNRSARIALLHYADGEKRYMLLPHGLGVGDTVASGPDVEARVGNALPLSRIPLGTQIHNIELVAGRGGQIVRSAQNSATCLSRSLPRGRRWQSQQSPRPVRPADKRDDEKDKKNGSDAHGFSFLGFIAFNAAIVQDGQTPLFCLPGKLALTTDQADDILKREAKKVPPSDDMPIGILLLAGLRETFPCEGQNK